MKLKRKLESYKFLGNWFDNNGITIIDAENYDKAKQRFKKILKPKYRKLWQYKLLNQKNTTVILLMVKVF